MSIIFNGKNHDRVYFNGKYHDKLYHGSILVWEKNTTPAETNLFILNGGYDITTACFGWNGTNPYYSYIATGLDQALKYHMAVMPCQPNTTYTIEMYVQDWCRVGSHSKVPTRNLNVNKSLMLSYQNTVGYNTTVSFQYRTGLSDAYVFIFYWGETANSLNGDYLTTYNTINIT